MLRLDFNTLLPKYYKCQLQLTFKTQCHVPEPVELAWSGFGATCLVIGIPIIC
jgi:hypothetical protein